jgi:ATP-dependent helicase/nuclease subunit A
MICILRGVSNIDLLNYKGIDLLVKAAEKKRWLSVDFCNAYTQESLVKQEEGLEEDVIDETDDNLADENLIGVLERRFNFLYPYENANKIPVKITATDLLHRETWKDNIAVSRPAFMSSTLTNAVEAGVILHNFMFFSNYLKASENLEQHLNDLINKGLFTHMQINMLNRSALKNFFISDLGKKILRSKKVLREYRFTVRYNINAERGVSDNSTEESVLMGSIDCVFEDDGEYIIVDYKTDKIQNIFTLTEKYARQLYIYKYAFEKCEGVRVKDMLIYSFCLNKFISVVEK